jgi:hypothetical protein
VSDCARLRATVSDCARLRATVSDCARLRATVRYCAFRTYALSSMAFTILLLLPGSPRAACHIWASRRHAPRPHTPPLAMCPFVHAVGCQGSLIGWGPPHGSAKPLTYQAAGGRDSALLSLPRKRLAEIIDAHPHEAIIFMKASEHADKLINPDKRLGAGSAHKKLESDERKTTATAMAEDNERLDDSPMSKAARASLFGVQDEDNQEVSQVKHARQTRCSTAAARQQHGSSTVPSCRPTSRASQPHMRLSRRPRPATTPVPPCAHSTDRAKEECRRGALRGLAQGSCVTGQAHHHRPRRQQRA